MLAKIVFFVLLAVICLALWGKRKRALQIEKKPQGSVSKKMVTCPVCGVHFAEVDGVWISGKTYCSLDCAQKSQKGE